jgi:hypothetical protein
MGHAIKNLQNQVGHLKDERNLLRDQLDSFSWQPIETAPLTDVGILIGAYFKDGNLYWIQDLVYIPGYGYRTQSHNNATHWMPLPEPPEED